MELMLLTYLSGTFLTSSNRLHNGKLEFSAKLSVSLFHHNSLFLDQIPYRNASPRCSGELVSVRCPRDREDREGPLNAPCQQWLFTCCGTPTRKGAVIGASRLVAPVRP